MALSSDVAFREWEKDAVTSAFCCAFLMSPYSLCTTLVELAIGVPDSSKGRKQKTVEGKVGGVKEMYSGME